LSSAASDTVHVSRLGGDEFALVIKGDISNEALLMFGKHLCTLMHESFELSEIPIQIGATLGFATFPATAETEFHVLFQPIIESCTRETVAFEALARWNSPELGAVSPAHFIPIAE
ncbi:EAL domain-containing protein, partial [Pseudomonas tremae]|uniref:EAL domain-containing protein n=1 Tax=Pseudomonas tremae TaxID=200454 RepID=UPI000516822E